MGGWQKTRQVYRTKVNDVLQGKVHDPHYPNHVPVYAMDLQYFLDELEELDTLRQITGVTPKKT
jgi:hypothetical protein